MEVELTRFPIGPPQEGEEYGPEAAQRHRPEASGGRAPRIKVKWRKGRASLLCPQRHFSPECQVPPGEFEPDERILEFSLVS